MCFSRTTNFKQVICIFALAIWATTANGTPQVIEGADLTEPLSIELDFLDSDYLLITASQTHADYSLEVIENNTKAIIRKVDFPYGQTQKEIILVHNKECQKCYVSLDAVEPIDMNSPYTLSIEPVDEAEKQLVTLLKNLTSAGEFKHKADTVDNPERRSYLEKANSQLRNAIESNNQYWQFHALLLLGYNYIDLDNQEKGQEVFLQLLDETENQESDFRAYALQEVAFFEKDQIRIQEIYDEMIRIGQQLNDQRVTALGKNAKAVNLVQNGNYSDAISLLEQAKTVFIESKRWRESMTPLSNLSWASQRAGMLPESLAYATEQLIMAESFGHKRNQVWALYNFAMTYREIGERFIADDFLDRAIKQHAEGTSSSDEMSMVGAWLLLEKTQTLLRYGAFESARDYAERTKQELDKLGHPDKSADVTFTEGQIAFATQNYELAEDKFRQVITFDQENNRTLHEGIHLLKLAELKITQKEFIEASTHQAKALKILSKTQHYRYLGRAFSQSAELLYYLDANHEAKKLLDRTGAFIEKHTLDLDKAQLAYRKALVANGVGDYKLASEYLTNARAFIESTLPKIRLRDVRQSYLALQKSIFELSIKVMLSAEPNNLLGALTLAETYKARTLAESINNIQNDNTQNIDNEISIQRNSILEQIQKNAAYWHKSSITDPEDQQSLLSDTRELSQNLEKLESQIASNKNKPQELSKAITIEQLPTALENELIAYYFISNNISWLWVITRESSTLHELPAEKEIASLAEAVLSQIYSPPTTRQDSSAWEQSSAIKNLSEILLSPLLSHLEENSSVDLVTIIPDGPLHGLPFSPLVLPETTLPLIKGYAISYAPSLIINRSLSNRLTNNNLDQNTKVLTVADPANDVSSNFNFADLPFSEKEALTIKSLAGNSATLLLSESATKANILRELSEPYSILHFATHGLLNRHEPSLSGLILSASQAGDNQLWLSPEISNTYIPADLVVLSACDSSIGKNISGEGLFSLSRAFIEGGASQVIGSLWSVQDQSTAALFENFYSNLFDHNLGVAKALQNAQNAILSDNNYDWSDPYYWAGFQLLGGGPYQTYAITE